MPGGARNLIFAPSNLTVTIVGDTSADGEWDVELGDGDEIVKCSFSAPSNPVPAAHDVAGDGFDTLNVDADGQVSASTMTAPNELTVMVLLDGAEVASEMFEPDFAIEEPNGRGCGERRLGSVELDW